MKGFFFTIILCLLLLLITVIGQVYSSYERTALQGVILRQWANEQRDGSQAVAPELERDLRDRVELYEDYISKAFLDEGMVIDRDYLGRTLNICDSLLFSSLRFVALSKLGYDEKAQAAWAAIEKVNENGHWLRHSKCRKTTSRDMILGVLAAFTQNPPNKRLHLIQTLKYVSENKWHVAKGRFDISYLSPGVAELFRIYVMGNRIFKYSLPPPVEFSFTTIDFSALLPPSPGYQIHLAALASWIELELSKDLTYATYVKDVRSPFNRERTIARGKTSIANERLNWITYKLYRNDPKNLFLRWLRIKSIDAMTKSTKETMIRELLAMPQFPATRLPNDCDRKADYLWQRSSKEYHSDLRFCGKYFNGVDFLWMSALLLEKDDQLIAH